MGRTLAPTMHLVVARPTSSFSTHDEAPSAHRHGDVGDETGPALAWLGPFGSERRTREVALVLQSAGIGHYASHGGFIAVAATEGPKARAAVEAYLQENRDWPPRETRERPRYAGLPWIAAAFALFVVFSLVTGPVRTPHGAWFREGASVSSLVLTSEPYRAVTALTLHADSEHVIGNLLSGALFGRAVERRLGPGGGLFAVMAAGTLGNLANAAFYALQGVEHRSIGASTAVFGAVGVLAATQIALRLRERSTRASTTNAPRGSFWRELGAPIAGGLALLATLGASPSSDLWAHAWGLVGGLLVGAVASVATTWTSPVHRGKQALLGAASVALVGGSWLVALA
jgi:membrane associated rhomboid family serine protease